MKAHAAAAGIVMATGLTMVLATGFLSISAWYPDARPGQAHERNVQQVREALSRVGSYSVDEPRALDGGVFALNLHAIDDDRPGWPALRVFVYPNAAAATAAHEQAHAQDEATLNHAVTYSDDQGPRLLSGYGASGWRGNVAVIQLSTAEDTAAFPAEPDCEYTPVTVSSGQITLVDGRVLSSLDVLDSE